MAQWRILLFLAIPLAVAAGVLIAPVAADNQADTRPVASADYKFQKAELTGVLSCASASCHAGSDTVRAGSEYTTWVNSDPHLRAFTILHEEHSRQIAKKLKLPKAAHESELCLSCHAPSLVADGKIVHARPVLPGVGCEDCHGPAEKYLATHYQDDFKKLSRTEKAEKHGLFPTKDLAFRVGMCASCHVGDSSREVNHDLIAAGHPRLAFEYTGYHHSKKYTRHWEESAYGPDFDARAWEIGQAASARAAIALTMVRAERAKARTSPWPELAEYSCYACHKNLKPGESWTAVVQSNRTPGSLPWSTWYLTTADLVMGDPESFQRETLATTRLMENPFRDPLLVAEQCKKIGKQLDVRLGQLQKSADNDSRTRPYDTTRLAKNMSSIARHALTDDGAKFRNLDWDGATQHYLAATAQYYAWAELDAASRNPRIRQPLDNLSELLEFPKLYNSPKGRDPAQILKLFQQLRNETSDPHGTR